MIIAFVTLPIQYSLRSFRVCLCMALSVPKMIRDKCDFINLDCKFVVIQWGHSSCKPSYRYIH